MEKRISDIREREYSDAVYYRELAKKHENISKLSKSLGSNKLGTWLYNSIKDDDEKYKLVVENCAFLKRLLSMYGYDESLAMALLEVRFSVLFGNKNTYLQNLSILSQYDYDKRVISDDLNILAQSPAKIYSCIRSTNSYQEFISNYRSHVIDEKYKLPALRLKVMYSEYVNKLNDKNKEAKLLLN